MPLENEKHIWTHIIQNGASRSLSAGWKGRDYIAIAHGGDASLRRRLSDEPGAFAKGGTVYIPADGFVLTDFFDRYVGEAFIDYSAIKESPPKPKPKPGAALASRSASGLHGETAAGALQRPYRPGIYDVFQGLSGILRGVRHRPDYARRDKRLSCLSYQ